MNYNQRTDYKVSRDLALGWWKAISAEGFQVHGPSDNARSGILEPGVHESSGPWVVLVPGSSDLAGVVAQPLTDGSGKWGLAVLWYDREKYSRFFQVLKFFKLSRSRDAAKLIGRVVLQQGGMAFPLPNHPPT